MDDVIIEATDAPFIHSRNDNLPCPFCGIYLENESPSHIWYHPRNWCLLSMRGFEPNDLTRWNMRYERAHRIKDCTTCAYKMVEAKDEPCYTCDRNYGGTPSKWEEIG